MALVGCSATLANAGRKSGMMGGNVQQIAGKAPGRAPEKVTA